MKHLRITFLTLCVLGSLVAQGQNPHWALYPLKKLDLSSNIISNLPGSPNTCNTANAKGLFDAAGNPIFYASNRNIYDRNGVVRFTIPVASTVAAYPPCVRGLHIIPVPNGSCGEYFVIYARIADIGAFPFQGTHFDGYEVGAIRVTVDANQDITVSNNIHRVLYKDLPYVIRTNIETALSKEDNGERTLYVSFRRSASPNFTTDQIVQIKVNNAGLSNDGGFMSTKNGIAIDTHTLELSPDQNSLAWIQWTFDLGYHMAIRNVNTGLTTILTVPNLGARSDIEFDANSNDIYVTTTQGVVKTSLSNPLLAYLITGTSNIHYGGDIERGINNQFYVTATNNQLYVIAGNSAASVAAHNSLTLPEHVDGERIQYTPAGSLQIFPQLLVSGHTTASVIGGSGNYTFTWRTPWGSSIVGNSALLCDRGTHTLTVRDNASGCSTTISFPNYPSGPCRSTSTNIELSSATVKAYPNPTTDYVDVQVNHQEKMMQLQVVDLQGKVMIQLDGNQQGRQRIETKGLKKGIYLLNVVTDRLRHQLKLVIK